ncbi:copper resistance protein CopC [Streptomyces sp. DSM 44915]|uniref:Copper resistance protein CopC n=1 Tax=Streptomyces chisholmiae TaxID=3075540 RepID=A0ABU2JQZ0_9ACTN|nr:copper resistance protein CopC [Streptomyces sp. DSM 44915]MDT0267163.1 copper resistance protein CopC [Streptomyces sp. DSM 44915]
MIAAVSRPLGGLLLTVGLAVGALAALLLGATPAAAHATLTGTSPGDGEVVAEAPAEVVLTFSEQVSVSDDGIRVLAPDGERVDTGGVSARAGGGEQGVTVRPDLADGTYTVAWQAISNDSHPIAGAFTFSVGAPSETSVTLATGGPDDGAVGLLYDGLRYAAYAGFLLLVGPAFFALVCWPGAAGRHAVVRLTLAGWLTLVGTTAALLLVRVPYTTTGRLSDALDLDGLAQVVDSRAGTALLSRLVLLSAAAFLVALLHGRYARAVAAGAPQPVRDLRFGLGLAGGALALGLAATWALAEHAATGPQTAVAIPADIVHLLAMACWLGGLATLVALARAPEAELPPVAAVRRFSTVALTSVAALAATGLYQSWRQVGTLTALTGTEYGRLLIAKLLLVGLLLCVAGLSRRWTAALPGPGAEPQTGVGAHTEGGATAEVAATPAAGSDAQAEARSEPATGSRAGTDAGVDARAEADVEAESRATAEVAAPPAADRRDQPAVPAPAGTRAERETEGPAGTGLRAGAARTGGAGGVDPVRARQLARQRRAAEAVRRRRAEHPARAGLRRALLLETAVAVAVLAVTTALTGTPPARTEAEAAPAADAAVASATVSYDTGGPAGAGTAALELTPGAVGENRLHVYLTGPDGAPHPAEEVRISLTLPAEELGPLRFEPGPVDVGHWTAVDVQLPRPGAWELDLTVRTSAIDQVTETTTLTVR